MENSLDYIITAHHYSFAEGADGTVKGRILKRLDAIRREKGVSIPIRDIDKPNGFAVFARIEHGQWIADCLDCKSAEFVSHSEPIFFCHNCFNRANNSRPRPVIFPDDREEIEALILERPVNDIAGLRDLERASQAIPLILVELVDNGVPVIKQLGRHWNPGESLNDIREQNIPVSKWHRLTDEGKSKPIRHKKKAGKQ